MAKINVSFHALPAEIIALAGEWADAHGLHIAAMDFSPSFRLKMARSATELHQHVESSGMPRRICLSSRPLDVNAPSPLEFMKRNSSSLVIEVGKHADDKLAESALAVKTENKDEMKIWRVLASDLKNRTTAGLWGLNPTTGAKHYYRENRYTATVAREVARGLQLVPMAGWNLFFIDEPNRPTESQRSPS